MAKDLDRKAVLDRYIQVFEELSRERLADFRELCKADVEFKDPFNHTHDVELLIKIMSHALDNLQEPKFSVTEVAWPGEASTAESCYLRWTMTFAIKPGGPLQRIDGISEIHFNDDGRVSRHIDHWDAAGQFYESLPLIGSLIRLVRRRLAVKKG